MIESDQPNVNASLRTSLLHEYCERNASHRPVSGKCSTLVGDRHFIAALRDSQNYVHAAAQGIGIFEMPAHKVHKDITQMNLIIDWLDQWRIRWLDALASSQYEHVPGAQVLTPAHRKSLR